MLWFSCRSPGIDSIFRSVEPLGRGNVKGNAEDRQNAWRNHGGAALVWGLLLGACTPTVQVATDEPITINLNVNIQHEIRVKVDKELDDIFGEDSEVF